MHFRLGIIFTTLIFCFSAVSAERAGHLKNIAKVVVKKSSGVSGGEVFLKDIANFENIPQAAREYLEGISVTKLDSQAEVALTSFNLSEMFREPIRKVQKEHGIRILFSMPPEVSIYIENSAFTEPAIKKSIVNHLKSSCSTCEFEVANLRLPIVSKSLVSNSWKIRFGAEPIKGVFSLPVVFANKKGGRNTFWISGKVMKKQMVPVATRRLQPAHRIQKGDFKYVYRDMTYAIDDVPDQKYVIGKKLRRGILAEHVIWSSSLVKKKAIRYGDRTDVVMGDGTWQIKTVAVAQENADIGDQIRLLNPKTRKYISGVVTGERQVRVK